MAGTVFQRLRCASDLEDAVELQRQSQSAGAIGGVVVHKRRAKALRDELLGRRREGAVGIDVMDPKGAAQRIAAHMGALQESGASVLKRAEDAAILEGVLEYVGRLAKSSGLSMGDQLEGARKVVKVECQPGMVNAHHHDQFFAGGRITLSVVDEALAIAAKVAEKNAQECKRLAELKDGWEAEMGALKTAMRPGQPGGTTFADYNDARYDLCAKLNERSTLERRSSEERIAGEGAAFEVVGEAVLAAVLEKSPVSVVQSSEWASKQEITKAAAARLRKIGYQPVDLRSDMAEFYRLTGGRLGTVKINTDGSTRANATGIHGHGNATINLDSRFDKRILWHELGHHLEADPTILAAARGFLAKRNDGSGLHSMRELTGSAFYRANEQAYRDGFFSHYVGKFYPDATEVFSMGVESFSSKRLLGERIAKDPEMFAMIEGALKSTPNELMALIHEVRATDAGIQGEKVEQEADQRDEYLKKVAAKITLDPSEPEVNPMAMDTLKNYYGKSYKLGKFIGFHQSSNCFYLVHEAGSVRDYVSAMERTRPKKGYLISKMSAADREGFTGNRGMTNVGVVGSLEEVKARIFRWVTDGATPVTQMTNTALKTYAI